MMRFFKKARAALLCLPASTILKGDKTVKRQFDRLDRWLRKRLRCSKFKRISRLDNWRWRNQHLARLGLVSLYSLVS